MAVKPTSKTPASQSQSQPKPQSRPNSEKGKFRSHGEGGKIEYKRGPINESAGPSGSPKK